MTLKNTVKDNLYDVFILVCFMKKVEAEGTRMYFFSFLSAVKVMLPVLLLIGTLSTHVPQTHENELVL